MNKNNKYEYGYVMRHWCGQTDLSTAFFVNFVALSFAAVPILYIFALILVGFDSYTVGEVSNPPLRDVELLVILTIFFGVWQGVGLLRIAYRHFQEGKPLLMPLLAVSAFLGLILSGALIKGAQIVGGITFYIVFWGFIAPLMKTLKDLTG